MPLLSSVSAMFIEMLDSASRSRRSLIWRPPTILPSWPTSGLVDAAKTIDIVGSSTWIGSSTTGSMRHVNMSPMSASSMPTTAQMSPAWTSVGLLATHALEGEEVLDVGLVAAAVVLDDEDALAVVQRAREDAADADTADEVRVVDGADLHRDRTVDVDVGRRDVLDDRVEQRDHVHVVVVGLVARVAVDGARVDDREVELRVVGAQVEHELEDLVDDLVRARARDGRSC